MSDYDELKRLAEAATPGPWTNIDALRGEKKSVWVADTAREETERDGVTPSRYGPSRTTICNALASNYSLPDGGYKTLDPYPNAAFIAAANPATVLALLAKNAALRDECDGMVEEVSRSQARLHAATEAERKLAEAVGLLRESLAPGSFEGETKINIRIRTFLSKEAERG
jgi:Ead/Ea22-like protein